MKTILVVVAALLLVSAVAFSQGSTYERTLTLAQNLRTYHVVGDTATFPTTQAKDTVVCLGTLATDFFLVTALNDTSSPSLSYIAKTDTVIFFRKLNGTSALQVGYLRIRPYKP